MHIEFRLPTGAGGIATQHVNSKLDRELREWSMRYNVTYTKTVLDYTARVEFEDETHYMVFALSWHYATPKWVLHD